MSYKTKRHRKKKAKKQTSGTWGNSLGRKLLKKFVNRKQKGWISWVTPGVVPKTYRQRQLGYGKKNYGIAPRRSFHIHE